jgi:hypothetical protein
MVFKILKYSALLYLVFCIPYIFLVSHRFEERKHLSNRLPFYNFFWHLTAERYPGNIDRIIGFEKNFWKKTEWSYICLLTKTHSYDYEFVQISVSEASLKRAILENRKQYEYTYSQIGCDSNYNTNSNDFDFQIIDSNLVYEDINDSIEIYLKPSIDIEKTDNEFHPALKSLANFLDIIFLPAYPIAILIWLFSSGIHV